MFKRIRKILGRLEEPKMYTEQVNDMLRRQREAQEAIRSVQTIEAMAQRKRTLGLEKLPACTVLVYRNKTPRSLHNRIYLDQQTSAIYGRFKYARYDLETQTLRFSNHRAEGYANVMVIDSQVCIHSKKLVEQIFYSKKVEVLPEGRTIMQFKIAPAGPDSVRM